MTLIYGAHIRVNIDYKVEDELFSVNCRFFPLMLFFTGSICLYLFN